MPSQRHHRRRTIKDVLDDERVEESHSEPYSRAPANFRQSSSYRTESTSNSNRTSYDMNREPSSSRASSWRPKDTEPRYSYPADDYYRDGREEYNVVKPREHESWPAHTPESRYPERDWSQRYDQGYSASSYEGPSQWAPVVPERDPRKSTSTSWTQDSRGHAFDSRPTERVQPVVEPKRDWNRDQRRGKEEQKWASGSGWDSGRSDNRNSWVEPSPRSSWKPPPEKKPQVDNRAWEPAPTWQPASSDEHQSHRNYYDHRNDYKTTSNGPRHGTNTTNNNNQRHYHHRRNDEGNPNNWSRRDNQASEKALESSPSRRTPLSRSPLREAPHPIRMPVRSSSPPPARKHLRSPSPSRSASRSPAESYYSRRSSRGRSKSPPLSPANKRRRGDSSPIVVAGRTSRDGGGHATWAPRSELLPQSTEWRRKQADLPVGGRGASPASSPERSPSRSPRARSLHRLSSAVSAPSIVSLSRTGVEDPRDFAAHRNGTNMSNGSHNKRALRPPQPLVHNTSMDIMPPPTIIPTPSRPLEPSYPSLPRLPMNPTRIVVKNTGFKPIGQSSSALKKFFPGDEDDMDISSDLSGVADSEVQVPEPPSPHLPPRPPEQQPRSEPLHASLPMRPADDVGVVELPRRLPSPPPLGISRDSSVAMEESSQPDEAANGKPSQPSSPPLHTPKQADLDASDNADISMSSTRTRNELYAIVSQVGEGTFGKVYKAQNTVTKLHVALKRIRMESEKEGFPVTAMREIKLLQSLRHENVIQLYEMMVSNGSVYMVFEYMDHDLTGILSQTQFSFTDAHLKSLSHQMLAGLAYLHHKGVIHRDIKGSNILINNQGELKLADFGLARFYQKRRRTDYTNRVITLWYRPPELLFGATIYGPEVDMWSAGCIMLELFTKKPVFQGNDEIHQLDTIYRVIGTPTTDRWPGVANLPWYELVKPRDAIPNHFREMFRKWMSPVALDLAERLLCYDPSARATALQAMEAPYFTQEEPRAMAPVGLATLHGEWHELDTKRERAKKRRRTETAIQ